MPESVVVLRKLEQCDLLEESVGNKVLLGSRGAAWGGSGRVAWESSRASFEPRLANTVSPWLNQLQPLSQSTIDQAAYE